MNFSRRISIGFGLLVSAAAVANVAACGSGSSSSDNGGTSDGGKSSGNTVGSGTSGGSRPGPGSSDGSISSGSGASGDDSADGGGGGSSGDDDAADAVDALADGPHASVRVMDIANPDILYLDVCFSTDSPSSTTNWIGPEMRGTYNFLQNPAVTPYFHVPVGTQSIRFVLANSTDCEEVVGGVPDFALTTALAQDSRTTIVLDGTGYDSGPHPLQIFQYADAVEPADGGNSLRMINLFEKHNAIDVFAFSGYGNKTPCTLMYSNVAYGAVGKALTIPGDGGPTDDAGYAPLRGENLYDLTFQSYTLGFADHGQACGSSFATLYTTDYALGEGAWTMYNYDENYGRLICRDDGTDNPPCEMH